MFSYLLKLARFCVTLAIRVSVRAVRSSGYSCVSSNRDGDITAGHRKRRNSDALIRRSLMSGRPRLPHSCRHDAKTSFSSLGNTLDTHTHITHEENSNSMLDTYIVCVCVCVCVCVPVGLKDLAEGHLAAHPQIGLVFGEVRGHAPLLDPPHSSHQTHTEP